MKRHVRWIVAVASLGVATAGAQPSNVEPHRPPPGGARRSAGGGMQVRGSVPPAPGGGMPGGAGQGAFSPMSPGGFGAVCASRGGACRIAGASAPIATGSSCSCGPYPGLTQ